MSRAGYSDDCGSWELIMWRGAVASAIRGRRGQQFFCDLVAALDAMPDKRLISGAFEAEGCVCALGALGKQKAVDLTELDTEDYGKLGETFDIAPALARETMYINDEGGRWTETPERRYARVRDWAESQLRKARSDGP